VVFLDSVDEYERAISENAHGTLLMYNPRSASGESFGFAQITSRKASFVH
jgi:hypothetical protein